MQMLAFKFTKSEKVKTKLGKKNVEVDITKEEEYVCHRKPWHPTKIDQTGKRELHQRRLERVE
jgi:uncharacterized short protein YbdD (DUF466 family)